MGPCIDASLYWLEEDAEMSFSRVCQYVMSRGLATANEIVASQVAAFVTASQGRSKGRRRSSRTPPGRLYVHFSPISDEVTANGDHPAIEVWWADHATGDPNEKYSQLAPWRIRDYRFFTELCATLGPLYANLTGEGWVPCAYDALHPDSSLMLSTFFCQDTLLGADASAFWATYVYTERAGTGTYGTDYLPWRPRKWTTGKAELTTQPSRVAMRKDLFLSALKRAYRGHRRQ